MPPESLWNQYSVVGILILAAGVIAAAFYRLWHELLDWFEKQDDKRNKERETQRTWEAQQKKEADDRWQLFLDNQQAQWLTQDLNHSTVIVKLIDKIEDLTTAINDHDTWARARDGK
jgi:hypothetical protein